AGDGQFRLNERYNEGYSVSGLRSGRPEPVEFSFLTGRSQHNPHPHPLQGDPRVFSYNPETEQQFDSSFWLGRNTMMPNPAGRNQMTGVCAWCRNEFHLQQAHSGAQDGIGSLCPSCSASVSGHVNML
nr:DNA-binding, integrase-type [Tanacetum cinerariifolium]